MARRPPPYPRDLVGYGAHPPDPKWPGGARLALSFVVNYEEGGERSILHGDRESEVYLHEVAGMTPRKGKRDESIESVYEYGSRAGFWRLMRLFGERELRFTSWAVGMAVERHPAAARAARRDGRVGLRVRQPRRVLAHPAHLRGAQAAVHQLRRRHGSRAQPRRRQGHGRGRA